jgi:hypothetical protein
MSNAMTTAPDGSGGEVSLAAGLPVEVDSKRVWV